MACIEYQQSEALDRLDKTAFLGQGHQATGQYIPCAGRPSGFCICTLECHRKAELQEQEVD